MSPPSPEYILCDRCCSLDLYDFQFRNSARFSAVVDMPPKRRAAEVEDDNSFARDLARVQFSMELAERVSQYPSPPARDEELSSTEAKAYARELIDYEVDRAEALGVPFLPPCKKCGPKKECQIDVTGLEGKRRVFKCASCIRGKNPCSNSDLAASRNERFRRFVAMGKMQGELGLDWKMRLDAHAERERSRKQAKIERVEAREEKKSDQVSIP